MALQISTISFTSILRLLLTISDNFDGDILAFRAIAICFIPLSATATFKQSLMSDNFATSLPNISVNYILQLNFSVVKSFLLKISVFILIFRISTVIIILR